jgi:hypothetical protein
MAALAGVLECSAAIETLDIGVGAAGQEDLDGFGVTISAGQHERCDAVMGRGIRISTVCDELPDDGGMTAPGCIGQGGPATCAGEVDFSSCAKLLTQEVAVSSSGGSGERREWKEGVGNHRSLPESRLIDYET